MLKSKKGEHKMKPQKLTAAQIKRAIGVFYSLKHARSWVRDMDQPTIIIIGDVLYGTKRYLLVSRLVGQRMLQKGFKEVK
jgi:hypothetical protein